MRNKFFLKIALIGGLIVLLMLPLGMIRGVVHERSSYRFQVEQDIANTWTGEQLLAGPLLSVPYSVRYKEKQWNKETEKYDIIEKTRWSQATFMPEKLTIGADIGTEYRSRGIYNVPVYAGQFKLDGQFSRVAIDEYRRQIKGFSKWGLPRLSLAIDDVRGIGSNPSLTWSNESVEFDPGTAVDGLDDGIQGRLPALPTSGEMPFSIELELRGSRHLRIAPIARDARVSLQSPWPHPKFTGRFLPSARKITADGFEADWQVSSFSTSAAQVLAECVGGNCEPLKATSFGVRFIETVDLYQKVTRAVKYGLLFILLTFVAFFLTETLCRQSRYIRFTTRWSGRRWRFSTCFLFHYRSTSDSRRPIWRQR